MRSKLFLQTAADVFQSILNSCLQIFKEFEKVHKIFKSFSLFLNSGRAYCVKLVDNRTVIYEYKIPGTSGVSVIECQEN